MRCTQLVVATATLALLGGASSCGSGSSPRSRSTSSEAKLGGPAPAQLVGTFKTTISRRDRANAPRPDELPVGSWTLVIGNSGGPNNSRALGVGNGDTDRVVYHFGVKRNVLSIACNDDQGLPTRGSQTYTWSTRGRTLTLKPNSPGCQHGDQNNQVILTSHPWAKQGANS